MFDLDPGKMFLVAVVALVVVGPKELPIVLRTLGQAAGRLRGLQSSMQKILADVVAEADLDDVGKGLESRAEGLWTTIAANPATAMRGTLPTVAGTTFDAGTLRREIVEYSSAEMEAYLLPIPDPSTKPLK